jgi:hypothetical protein
MIPSPWPPPAITVTFLSKTEYALLSFGLACSTPSCKQPVFAGQDSQETMVRGTELKVLDLQVRRLTADLVTDLL